MRSTTFALAALASLAAASAESIFFTAESSDNSVNGPISSIHEGAGINYFLISSGGSGEIFDLENGIASNKQGNFDAYVGALGNYFASGPAISPETLTFNGNVLESYNFWACRNTNDPYSYSTRSPIIAVNSRDNNTAPFDECTPVTISKNSASSISSSVYAASPSVVPAHYSWTNGTTITTDVTVTGFTTYCPSSTVVTITTCSDHRCAPSVITATSATTITITGECVIPTTITSGTIPTTHVTYTSKAVITTDVTVTGYTTFCPESTVVTITTCSNHRCAPEVITAASATTIIITGECVIPTTITSGVIPPTEVTHTSKAVITTDVTVTGYTTYCPESTIVTVTTCSDHRCAPHVITATAATTITVTGECVIPTTITSNNVPITHIGNTATVVTTDVTVTGFTTFCPASTVVTITTCSNNRCAPTTVSVTEATTLTVTGECVVPTTITTTPSISTYFSSAAVSSVHSTAGSVTVSQGGAGKAAVGAVGFVAGVFALLI